MSADPLIGSKIDRYQVERQIGAGGMGKVYLARQPEIGARVAIKVVNAVDASDREEWTRRLFAEARAVNLISHENIVNVLDMVRLADGRPALVMEFLNGVSLDRLIHESGAPLPLGIVGDVVVDVLSAIGAAHRAGILHRDLKPANVFVTPEGRAKVLDFGIAKAMDGAGMVNSLQTQAGKVLGTAVYMAPEQARGETIDERADLFAVGLILYEAATRRRAIRGPSLGQVLEQHGQPIAPAGSLRAEVTPELEAVIDRALKGRPADRFASAGEMAAALRSACTSLLRSGRTELTAALASTGRIELGPVRDMLADPEEVRSAVESAQRSSQAQTEVARPAPDDRGRRRWPVVALPLAIAAGLAVALLVARGDGEVLALETPALPIDAGSVDAPLSSETVITTYRRGGERAAAIDAARILLDDAEVSAMTVTGAFTDQGFRLGRVRLRLFSPRRAGGGERLCAVIAAASGGTLTAELDRTGDCGDDAILSPPRCSIRDVMARAWLAAAPSNRDGAAVALELRGDTWSMAIDGEPQRPLADRCGEAVVRPRPSPGSRTRGGDLISPFDRRQRQSGSGPGSRR